MGLFKSAKRAVKKITKPVAKVLDKVVPNELKPFLPYASAVAPYLLPAGIAGGSGIGALLRRGALTGGINLASQLAQEGSEGDFSALSLGLAGLQGALTAPGAAETLQGMTTAGSPEYLQLGEQATLADAAGNIDAASAALGDQATMLADRGLLTKAADFGLGSLSKGAEAIDTIMTAGAQDPFSMAGLKAASIPFTQGSVDLGMATARKALQDYEAELAAFNAQAGADQEASDSARRAAIIASMTRADFTQDVIDETLGQLGLKDGGRVGFENGGTPVYLDNSLFKDKEYLTLLKDSGRLEDEIQKLTVKEDVPSASKYATLRKLYDETSDKGDRFAKKIDEEVKEKFPDADMGKIDPFDRFPMEVMLIEKILEKQGKTIDDLDKEYGELLEKKGLTEVANKIISDYYSKSEKKSNGGIARLGFDKGGDVEGKIDLMGDLSKEDKKTFAELKKLLFDATIKDRPGYAQNMLEVANPFDDKDADSKGSQERARAFDRGNKRLIYGIISTKNDPEGREKFVEEFTENYENMMYPAGRMAEGGIASFKEGGIMNLGGKEMDMRTGGFIPIGAKERADDVPARLSKNEFVMTADAVRAAGGGSVNKGAKRMYDLMHNLEARA
jgi:hypothetical protein